MAKLRYQLTKVDGADPAIPVEQVVVNVIVEQQKWLATTFPRLEPKYLFIGAKATSTGSARARTPPNSQLLAKLDDLHGLTDGAGNPLRFSQTHRLRHTRATELRNDGVPIHVVQRYLGHKSPEITLRYATTLAATAEAEFLKHKKIGAQASLKTLAAHTQKRRDSVDTRAPKALQGLRREKADITISSVARRAGVTRKSIHNRPKLLAQIEAHRTLAVVSDEPQSASGGAESGIIAALRNRLTVKDTDRAATS